MGVTLPAFTGLFWNVDLSRDIQLRATPHPHPSIKVSFSAHARSALTDSAHLTVREGSTVSLDSVRRRAALNPQTVRRSVRPGARARTAAGAGRRSGEGESQRGPAGKKSALFKVAPSSGDARLISCLFGSGRRMNRLVPGSRLFSRGSSSFHRFKALFTRDKRASPGHPPRARCYGYMTAACLGNFSFSERK